MKQVKFLFKVFNPNPMHKQGTKVTTGDCVIRAICKATGKDWYEVYDLLCAKGRQMGDWGNMVEVYTAVLDDLGFERVSVKRQKGVKAVNVKQFIEQHPDGVYILRLAHHLTCVYQGCCYDTWYPDTNTIYCYWTKK